MESITKLETQPKPRLIVCLGVFLASHHILFSILCCSAGIITLLFLPSLAKNTYLSENALIPGSANPLFSTEDAIEANRFMKGIEAVAGDSRGEIMANFIAQQIEALGAEVCYHKFIPHSKNFHPLKFFISMKNDMAIQPKGTDTNFGINTIGIIRAPRGDEKEAIVLVSPYNSRRVQSNELLSLALGFFVFSLLSRAAWLSNDVVWLSADSQFGEYAAVSAWLNQYHNPVFLNHSVTLHTKMYGANHIYDDGNSEKTEVTAFKRAGTMATAVIFKVGETRRYGDRDSVMMYAEASNGQMPNLDLLNVVHYLAVHRQGFRVNIAAFSSLLSSAWLRVIAEFLHTVGSVLRKINPDWKLDIAVPDYVEGTANLANSIYNQALGVPTWPHGAFRDYQVDAVSLEFSPTFHFRNENAKSLFLLRGGRLIEGVVRSVNNLLEKFHQSFFLYFLTSPSKFISVGIYMIPFALLLAPLPIVAAALADGSRGMEKPVDKLTEHGKADDIADIPQSNGGSCKWLQAAKVLLVIQLWAVLVSLLPYYITQIPDVIPMHNAVIWVFLSVVILIALSVLFGSPYSAGVEWKLLKATMITSISIGLGLMSIINFATAQLGALIVIPMCLFSRPLKASGMNFLTRAVLLASNIVFAVLGFPPATVLIMKVVFKGSCSWTTDFGDFWIWMKFLWEWSSATYLYLYLVHLPCWLLCILVLLHPCRQLQSKMKQE